MRPDRVPRAASNATLPNVGPFGPNDESGLVTGENAFVW